MANSWFQFKQFTLHHHLSAMKVGTDGVLLGAWADGSGAESILDIGTGSGLLALMMAQRFSMAKIHAIDIVEDAARQAQENVTLSPWNNRIEVEHSSLQQFAPLHPQQFDLVICNPPYFTNSLKAPDQHRSLARHNHDLTFHELAEGVYQVMKSDSRFCVVIPADQQLAIHQAMAIVGLFPHRQLNVYPLPNKPIKRVLIEFRSGMTHCVFENLTIETYERHQYTDDYKLLTKDFYLKF